MARDKALDMAMDKALDMAAVVADLTTLLDRTVVVADPCPGMRGVQ
tara:strand:- start:78 stop:215 length:138 start_codon:yes stop_codon:yes gene_type:complete